MIYIAKKEEVRYNKKGGMKKMIESNAVVEEKSYTLKNENTSKNELTHKDSKNKRILYFDILNILACLSVVFLHSNSIVHTYTQLRAWKTALIFEVVLYWAVPVFIMLSGATLMKYKERYDTKTFFKKRFSKILIPWIIWSFVLYIVYNHRNINILQFGKDFLYCKIESIYWFFPLILYLYCLIPVLSIIAEKEENRKMLKAIFLFIFIFRAIIYPICVMCNIEFPTVFKDFISQNGYLMFLILGYLLSTTNVPKKKRIIIYILGLFAIVFKYCYTYYFSIKEGKLNNDLFDYCAFTSVLLAIAVFVFIKNINWEKIIGKLHITPNMIAKISSYSFGVYLIHIIIKIQGTKFLKLNPYGIIYRTVGAIVIYIISVIAVWIMKKIPIIRKTVP